MKRSTYTAHIWGNEIIFEDPDADALPLIKAFDPDYEVKSVLPPPAFIANVKRIRAIHIPGLYPDDLVRTETAILWDIHNSALHGRGKHTREGSVSLMDLKVELARRAIMQCELCGHRCGVNRFKRPGKCGLQSEAHYSRPFVHIAEEQPINLIWNIKVFGCSFSCLHCQSPDHLKVSRGKLDGRRLDERIWDELRSGDARALEWIGGDPTPSIYPIMKVMNSAPEWFNLPVVWNSNAYLTDQALKLLEGMVDAYVPDVNYADNRCAKEISGIDGYWETATSAVETMVKQKARVIVRILLLPGHFQCCEQKVVEWLSKYRETLWLSVLDQYIPKGRALNHPVLNQRPSLRQIEGVKRLIHRYGLREVNDHPEGFWK